MKFLESKNARIPSGASKRFPMTIGIPGTGDICQSPRIPLFFETLNDALPPFILTLTRIVSKNYYHKTPPSESSQCSILFIGGLKTTPSPRRLF